MLYFESSLSNTLHDDDDDDVSVFLLSLATSRAALGGTWVLDFTIDGITPAGNLLFAFITRLSRHV